MMMMMMIVTMLVVVVVVVVVVYRSAHHRRASHLGFHGHLFPSDRVGWWDSELLMVAVRQQ